MGINWGDIEGALLKWAHTSTNLNDGHVIFAFENGPRPSLPYMVINRSVHIGRAGMLDEENQDPDNPDYVLRNSRRHVRVKCDIYGPNAMSMMEQAQEFLETYQCNDIFSSIHCTVVDFGKIINLTGLMDTKYVERAELEIVLSTIDQNSEKTGYISSVRATDNLQNDAGVTVLSNVFTDP